jgi:hypothetical protein
MDHQLTGSLRELSELGSSSSSSGLGGRTGEALVDRCTARMAEVQAARCYYVAHVRVN